MDKLVKLDANMDRLVYEMYQDIPKMEMGSQNPIFGEPYSEYQKYLEQYKKEESIPNIQNHDATTNRYIYYVDNYPVGEIGIRTKLNDFWMNKGSQLFYKIRLSERNKGYGTQMLKLALIECKKLGFQKVRINCDDTNTASKVIIIRNGGKVDIEHYKTNDGTSSSYVIVLGSDKNAI